MIVFSIVGVNNNIIMSNDIYQHFLTLGVERIFWELVATTDVRNKVLFWGELCKDGFCQI